MTPIQYTEFESADELIERLKVAISEWPDTTIIDAMHAQAIARAIGDCKMPIHLTVLLAIASKMNRTGQSPIGEREWAYTTAICMEMLAFAASGDDTIAQRVINTIMNNVIGIEEMKQRWPEKFPSFSE
jgi:hypothetical protein